MLNNYEIDKLVAEKVMGWELNDEGVAWKTEFGELFFTYPYDDDNEWSPSTDIKDAWLVVEKLRKENDYWFELGTDQSFSLKYKCYFQLDDMESEVIAETAPMAICLAALKSVGIEIEQ